VSPSTSTGCGRRSGTPTPMRRGWKRVLELNRSHARGLQRAHRRHHLPGSGELPAGHTGGGAYFDDLVEEMEWPRTAIGTLPEELHRLHLRRRALLPDLPPLRRAVHRVGRTFVNSTYMHFASGGANAGHRVRPGATPGEPGRGAPDRRFGPPWTACSSRRTPYSGWSRLPGRRDRLPPHQELPHGLHRARGQPPRGHGAARRTQPVHRVRHDGPASRVRSPAQEPDRRLLRGLASAAPGPRPLPDQERRPWHTQQEWMWDPRRRKRSSWMRPAHRGPLAHGHRSERDPGGPEAPSTRRSSRRPRGAGGPLYVVGTGYGRYKVTFGNTQVTEISCHGRGAVHMFPGHGPWWTWGARTPRRSASRKRARSSISA
jgi:hypothetical protein